MKPRKGRLQGARARAERPGKRARTAGRPPAGILLLGLLALVAPLQGQERSLSIQHFHSEIQVLPDGSFQVRETLTIRFTGSWNGLERGLSLDHRTAQGRRGRLRIEMGQVTDGEGNALEVERSGGRSRVDLRIWIPDAQDAIRTVVIPYQVQDGIRFFDGPDGAPARDELYYNVTGNDWRIPIQEVTSRIALPPGAEPLEVWGYTGPAGATERAVEIREEGGWTHVTTTRPFTAGEGLTVSVSWPPGHVERPSTAHQVGGTLRDVWPMGLPLLALAVMGRLWWRKGRDPAGRALMVEYEPPEELTPAEAGTLVDHRAEIHDITSTLVDLAVRGYVEIEELPGSRRPVILGGTREDWAFHQRRPRSTWRSLVPHERAFLEGLFPEEGPGGSSMDLADVFGAMSASFGAWRASRREGKPFDASTFLSDWLEERRQPAVEEEGEEPLLSVKLSELENRFHTHLEGIRTKIYGALKEKGLYLRRPDHQVTRWTLKGVALLFASVMIALMVANGAGVVGFLPHPLAAGLGVGLSGVVVLLVGQGMGVRTEEGVRVRDRIRGFRQFLSRVESDYIHRVITTPDLFERFLPYAIALKVDARWGRAFEGIYNQPPEWYRGASPGAPFQAGAFAARMASLSTRAGQTFSSTPGSSGSGGGGSSGGGSGGGGGGGF